MKIIILLIDCNDLTQNNQFNIPLELVDEQNLFVIADRPVRANRGRVITLSKLQATFSDCLAPPGTDGALKALAESGHILSDEAIVVLDGRRLADAMHGLSEAMAMYRDREELPVISVSNTEAHPCTWVHLEEVVAMDLVALFDFDYTGTSLPQVPATGSFVGKALPGPWDGDAFGKNEQRAISISPGPLSCPEDLFSTIKSSGGEMDFIREGDLCRRVFQEGFNPEGTYGLLGCSMLYPSDSSMAYIIAVSGGGPYLLLDIRFIESGDIVRLVPMNGNTMADDLEIETVVPSNGKILDIKGPRGLVRQAIELDCTLPKNIDIDGYLITILRSHHGRVGDVEQFFTPNPGLWKRRIFPRKRHLYNLTTGDQIQGRQQYPEVFTPSGHLYAGTMEQFAGLCRAQELAFIEID